jgi:hypothetical protein
MSLIGVFQVKVGASATETALCWRRPTEVAIKAFVKEAKPNRVWNLLFTIFRPRRKLELTYLGRHRITISIFYSPALSLHCSITPHDADGESRNLPFLTQLFNKRYDFWAQHLSKSVIYISV